jgi:transcriptional regulator with XRE-family HTH domain
MQLVVVVGRMQSIDSVVGERIRKRRLALGMTQTDLAERINVRFQQVQKYENGLNRVAASRLWQIALALEVPVNYFFESVTEAETPQQSAGISVSKRRMRELVDLFADLPDAQQSAVMSFLRSLAS